MHDIPLCTNKVDDENHCDVLTLTSSVPSLTYKCTNTDKIQTKCTNPDQVKQVQACTGNIFSKSDL